MGFVDRGGGREAKGSSLRRSKKNPGAAAARVKAEPKQTTCASPFSQLPPMPRKVLAENGSIVTGIAVDCSVAWLSRKFEADREKLCDRALSEGSCGAIITWCSEVERQDALLSACADHSGQLYCSIGVHPDNIDRTNKKSHEMWLEQVERLGMSPDCVALLTGINMMREPATHFAQEAMLKSLYALASRLRLPLVVHSNPDDASIEAMLSLLQTAATISRDGSNDASADADSAERAGPTKLVLHNTALLLSKASTGLAQSLMDFVLAERVMCEISVAGLDMSLSGSSLGQHLLALAKERLVLLSSDSPWNTPQNIPDEYLRTLHNEPANVRFVRQWIIDFLRNAQGSADVLDMDQSAIERAWTEDAVATFFSDSNREDDEEPEGGDEGKTAPSVDGPEPKRTESSDEKHHGANPDSQSAEGPAGSLPEAGPQPVPLPHSKPDSYLSCVKCRATLFPQTMLVTHPANAKRVTFGAKSGKGSGAASVGGSCEATFFISLFPESEDDGGSGAQSQLSFNSGVRMECAGDSAVCGGCKCKLGTVAFEAPCPCGCVVPGMTARLVASRVEVIDTTASVATILSKAAQEAEQLEQQRQQDEDEESDDGSGKKRQKKPKSNVKASNRSNFTNYRNKTFAASSAGPLPGASSPSEEVQVAGKKRNKKGKRGNDSDDES
jgi:Tat protein secretion system quality control protein TatD with DNase activity